MPSPKENKPTALEIAHRALSIYPVGLLTDEEVFYIAAKHLTSPPKPGLSGPSWADIESIEALNLGDDLTDKWHGSHCAYRAFLETKHCSFPVYAESHYLNLAKKAILERQKARNTPPETIPSAPSHTLHWSEAGPLSAQITPAPKFSEVEFTGPGIEFRKWWDSSDHTFGGDATPMAIAGIAWETAHRKYSTIPTREIKHQARQMGKTINHPAPCALPPAPDFDELPGLIEFLNAAKHGRRAGGKASSGEAAAFDLVRRVPDLSRQLMDMDRTLQEGFLSTLLAAANPDSRQEVLKMISRS